MVDKYFIIKETGDIIEYIGKSSLNSTKMPYAREYRILIPKKFIIHQKLYDFELFDFYNHKLYTLVSIPKNTFEILYGVSK